MATGGKLAHGADGKVSCAACGACDAKRKSAASSPRKKRARTGLVSGMTPYEQGVAAAQTGNDERNPFDIYSSAGEAWQEGYDGR